MVGGLIVGTIIDKLDEEIPDPIGSIVMFLLYVLPVVLGIPLFLKEKIKENT